MASLYVTVCIYFIYIYLSVWIYVSHPLVFVMYISVRPEQLGLTLHAYAHAGAS